MIRVMNLKSGPLVNCFILKPDILFLLIVLLIRGPFIMGHVKMVKRYMYVIYYIIINRYLASYLEPKVN
jgi:hypothetical protein